MGLRSYLVVLVLAAILPPVGFSVFMMIDFSLREDGRVRHSLTSTARALAVAVDREVAGTISALRALAASENLEAGVDARRFDAKARRVLQNDPLWRAMVLTDSDGRQLVNTSAPFGASLPPLADRPAIRQALATGRPVVADLVLGRVTKTLIIPIAVPVSRGGRVRYVLEAAYDAGALSRLFAQQDLPPGGVGSLLDRSGIVIARTQNAERFVSRPAPPELARRAALSSEGAGLVTTLDGVSAHAAFSRAPLSGWTVTVAIPDAAAAARARRSFWFVVGAGVWSIILGVLLAALLGWRGVRAIRSLVASTRALGRGEDFANPASFITELSELGGAVAQAATQRRQALGEALTRTRQQAAVADLGRRALTGLDASSLLDEALSIVARTLDTQYACVLGRLPDRASLSLRVGTGWEAGGVSQTTVRLDGEAEAFFALLEQGPLIIEQIDETSPGLVSILRRYGAVSCLWTGIRGSGFTAGVLGVAATSRRTFTRDDANFVQAVANVLADAIARSDAEEERRRLLIEERNAREMAATLADLVRLLSESLEPNLVVRRVVDNIRTLLGAQSAALYLLNQGADSVVVQAISHNEARDFAWPDEAPADTGLGGLALREGGAAASSDILHDARIQLPPETALELESATGRARLAVPLVAHGRTLGVLVAADRTGRVFHEEQIELATAFASHAALAVRNARLYQELERNLQEAKDFAAALRSSNEELQWLWQRLVETQEAERRGVARELHDQVGQILTALKMTIEIARRSASAEVSARLRDAEELVDDLLRRIRDLSLDLRPPLLDDLGLLPALLWHFEQYTARTNVRVAFRHRGLGRRFRTELETGAYRILQEALTNVARHGAVDEVEVSAWVDVENVNIQIEDRGAGFDPEEALVVRRSTGLSGMQERAVVLGGRLHLETSPGNGTHLSISLPLRDEGSLGT